jgi:hypothetical protein
MIKEKERGEEESHKARYIGSFDVHRKKVGRGRDIRKRKKKNKWPFAPPFLLSFIIQGFQQKNGRFSRDA